MRNLYRVPSILILSVWLVAACSGELRGAQQPSPDGKTYLLFEQLDGPACATVFVNGKVWPHKVGFAGEVKPGETVVKCSGEVGIVIKPGHTFRFNYWGP